MKFIYLLPIVFFAFSFNCHAQKQTTGFTLEIINNSQENPSIDDIQNGNFSFVYYLNGSAIEAAWQSYTVIHLPSSGETNTPVSCTAGEEWTTPMDYLKTLKIIEGDSLILEDVVIQYKGKEFRLKEGATLVF